MIAWAALPWLLGWDIALSRCSYGLSGPEC